MKEPIKNFRNLIQSINSMPDDLLNMSQTAANPNFDAFKLNSIRRYKAMQEIDAKSKLWKKLIKLELDAPIKTAEIPEICDYPTKASLEEWSGVMEISDAKVSIYLEKELRSKGVIFKDISSAFKDNQDLFEKTLVNSLPKIGNKLTELIASTANHGFLFSIPEGLQVKKPFKIIVKSSGAANFFPLNFVTLLNKRCSIKVVIEFATLDTGQEACFMPYLHICEIGASSEIELVEIQSLGSSVFLFPNESIEAGEKTSLNRFILDKGSRVTHRVFAANLNQTGANAQVTGVYFPHGSQEFIYDTFQNHLASETTSNLLFKGVLDNAADVLWKGNIFVKEGIHGADGYQLNNTLLMSPNTHAESIPGLEICADDVKCSHGVTISSIDSDQLFYLQSRGINVEDSNQLVVEGFIHAAISRIKSNDLQNYVKEALDEAEAVF